MSYDVHMVYKIPYSFHFSADILLLTKLLLGQ